MLSSQNLKNEYLIKQSLSMYATDDRAFSTTNSISVPSLEDADAMRIEYSSLDNTTLVTLSKLNNYNAASEVLKRHVMSVKRVTYAEAHNIFQEIQKTDRKMQTIHSIPYKIGIFTSLGAGFISIPLVFNKTSVSWFNQHYVTTDVPEPKDLETMLEVGTWSWNWMEPPLGQISFMLLCMTYARAQLQNLGLKPFTAHLKMKRAESLVKEYPIYDAEVLKQFSVSDTLT